jgi:hypothetical protein
LKARRSRRSISSIQTQHSEVAFSTSHSVYIAKRRLAVFNNLQRKYATDADFALMMRMLFAVAFIPVTEVVAAFEKLCDSGMYPTEAQSVLDYFEDAWIGRSRLNRQRAPLFQHSLWNCYELVTAGLHVRPITHWKAGIADLLNCCLVIIQPYGSLSERSRWNNQRTTWSLNSVLPVSSNLLVRRNIETVHSVFSVL